MKKHILLALSFSVISLMSQGQELTIEKNGTWMGQPYELTEAPNGAWVNKSMMTQYKMYEAPLTSNFVKKQIVKVADGIYSIEGVYVGLVTVIETPNGVILFDSGENLGEGREVLRLLESVTKKPVVAVIYSHSHYVYGTAAIKAKYPNVQIIAHPKLHTNVTTSGGVGSIYPEISPLLIANAVQQFHMMLPREGKDAPFGAYISVPETEGYVPPTRTVHDQEVLKIDGIDFQFFTEYNVDSDDCLLVWMPSKKAALSNLYWGVMPNMYSLRGSNYRDPQLWTEGLYKVRELAPEYLLSTHGMPVKGAAESSKIVETYADLLNFVKDQTLRAMLLGKSPQDLGKFVTLPDTWKGIDQYSETYGLLETFPEAIYQYCRGWFDSDAANIFKLPREEEARNIVNAIGGSERVLQLAEQAIKNNDQIWALKLINYLYINEPTNQVYREKKAQLLYQMGMVLESQNARSWCLTQAYALTGKINLPRVFLPREMAVNMSNQTMLSQYKVRINPEKAQNSDYMLVFEVDGKNPIGLHCRRGLVEYVENIGAYKRKADATLQLTHTSVVDLFLNAKQVSAILSEPTTHIDGDRKGVQNFLEMFDEIFAPQNNQAVPVISKAEQPNEIDAVEVGQAMREP